MKKLLSILFLSIYSLVFVSCNNDDSNSETAVFAVPIVKSLAKIRSEVGVKAAQPTASDGKIYVIQNYLFYISQEEGVHIFNNQNPSTPQNIAFLAIQGVHDIAVKGHYLYADNFVDLLVFDISNINNITLVQTVENTITFMPTYPSDAEFYAYADAPDEDSIIVGFKSELRTRPTGDMLEMYHDGLATSNSGAAAGSVVGTGGSYAKFQINKNALYTTDSFKLNVFNISSPEQTYFDKSVYMEIWVNGGEFETLFQQGNYLFIGATSGMYIADATDEFNPQFISGFSHATACDPVVVSGNTAYITVRGGTSCGTIDDQINVIDISNIYNPWLVSTTLINAPKGIGIRGDALYVCADGGLKVFDAANATGLVLKNSYSDNVTDVIPLESHFIAVGSNKIIQYSYGPDFTLVPLSTLSF